MRKWRIRQVFKPRSQSSSSTVYRLHLHAPALGQQPIFFKFIQLPLISPSLILSSFIYHSPAQPKAILILERIHIPLSMSTFTTYCKKRSKIFFPYFFPSFLPLLTYLDALFDVVEMIIRPLQEGIELVDRYCASLFLW